MAARIEPGEGERDARRRAWGLKGNDKIDDALDLFDAIVNVWPTSAGAWWDRGLAYHFRGDYATALASYQMSVAIDPPPPGFPAWNVMNNAAKGKYPFA